MIAFVNSSISYSNHNSCCCWIFLPSEAIFFPSTYFLPKVEIDSSLCFSVRFLAEMGVKVDGVYVNKCIEQWKKSVRELWLHQQHMNVFYCKPISEGHIKGKIKCYWYTVKWNYETFPNHEECDAESLKSLQNENKKNTWKNPPTWNDCCAWF